MSPDFRRVPRELPLVKRHDAAITAPRRSGCGCASGGAIGLEHALPDALEAMSTISETELVLALLSPGFYFVLHGEDGRRRHGKTRVQLIGLCFQRYGDPGTRLQETSNVKISVTIKSEKSHLRDMDHPVEERSQRNFLMKNDDVQVGDRSEMNEVRKITGAHRYGFGIKRRWRNADTLENHGPDALKQSLREKRPDGGSPIQRQRLTRAEINLSFLAQIRCDSGNHLGYAFFRELSGIHCRLTFFPGQPDCTLQSLCGQSNERCIVCLSANHRHKSATQQPSLAGHAFVSPVE